MHTAKAAEFCRTARRVFERDNILSLSYASRQPDQGLEPVHALAQELDAVIEWSDVLDRYLLVSPDLTMTLNWNHLAPVERAERFTGAWDGDWFEEDYCEGPGQALIVTPRGEVKPCCGFASDLDQLTIGNIYRDTVQQIVRRARRHPYVGKVFREGLTAIRDEILARDPNALPGATCNHCYFCWYVLTRGLAAGVNGGGGQVGSWTGERPNHAGLVLQLGLEKVATKSELATEGHGRNTKEDKQAKNKTHSEPTMELVQKDITEQIIGASFEVFRELGYGFLERVYQRAMQVELELRGLKAEIEKDIQVHYKGQLVGDYRADILVNGCVLVELKVSPALDNHNKAQLLNELKATGIKVGLLINFGRQKVEFNSTGILI